MKYGYVRVSTEQQDVDMQVAAMKAAGLSDNDIYRDVITGKTTSRDGLDLMLGKLKPGDVLYVWKLDRLGRRLSHLSTLVDSFIERKIGLFSLTEGFDVATPAGKAMMGMCAVFAEMERNTISERTKAKLQYLKAQGRRLGRPPVHADKYSHVRQLLSSGLTCREVSKITGVSKSQVSKIEHMEAP